MDFKLDGISNENSNIIYDFDKHNKLGIYKIRPIGKIYYIFCVTLFLDWIGFGVEY